MKAYDVFYYETEDGEKYEYQPTDRDLQYATAKIFAEEFGVSHETAQKILYEFDIYNSANERYYDDLKEYFEKEAKSE